MQTFEIRNMFSRSNQNKRDLVEKTDQIQQAGPYILYKYKIKIAHNTPSNEPAIVSDG